MTQRILILDDSLTVRMDLCAAFETAGFACTLAATAEEGRRLLAAQPHALIVLDVLLPDADGLEVLRDLRADPATASLPVILLSSEAEVRDRIRGLEIGADDYVGKPYDAGYLVARARALLGIAAPRRETPCVLVIEDSATFREAMREVLSGAGYEVVMAASGEEGLRLASLLRPDAAVIDGMLPGIDGTAVLRRIRMDAALHRMPCVLLTGSEETSDEVRAIEAGADAYVRKGENPGVILARLAALLRTAGPLAAQERGTPKRILAVDDSRTYLDALGAQLREEGYDVSVALSGEEALALLKAQSVDCILLDLVMPGMSGPETCRSIKQRAEWRDIPLAIHSVADAPSAMIDGFNAGADDYILKSEDFEVLKGRLRALLRRKHFEDENRRFREDLLRNELAATEARSARELAETRALLLADLERKNAELALAKDRAEAAKQAQADFLAQMSHEIRTPLTALIGASDVLGATPLSEEQQRYVELFRRGGENLLNLVNDILDLSKVEAGQIEVEQTAFVLAEVAEKAIELAGLRAAEKGLTLTWHIAPEVPTAIVGDPHRLGQVLTNLLSNAIKFTAQGSVELRIAMAAPGQLRVSVLDTGIGIPPNKLEHIFERFTQAEAGTTRRFGGTGLGLAISRGLVEALGGRLWAENRPEGGSAFHLTLPVGTLATDEPAAAGPAAPQPVGARRALRILLAEDSADNRTIFQAFFQRTPHSLEMVENGQLAVERFQAGNYDLVFMDMQMPVMDGYAATRAIRAWERRNGRPETPILALTAFALKSELEKTREAGCTHHLTKPITRARLLEAVSAYADVPIEEATIVELDAELEPLVPNFLKGRTDDALAIREALAMADWAAVAAVGHRLAGCGGTFGFDRITELGRAIMAASAAQDAAEVSAAVDELGAYVRHVEVVYRHEEAC